MIHGSGAQCAAVAAIAATLSWLAPVPAASSAVPQANAEPWCAPELETMTHEACHFSSTGPEAKKTLVVFLHGVIKPDTTWQYAQQRAIVRGAKTHRFSVLFPRGRRGNGPQGMKDYWAWPTGARAQRDIESALVQEWRDVQNEIEKRQASAFEQVFVFGFSNGAFYASSLALRGRLPDVDGYAVFAGGSAPKYLRARARSVDHRPPFYVGIGKKDRYREDGRRLARALASLGWKHRTGERNVGHVMADSQVAEAIEFLKRN